MENKKTTVPLSLFFSDHLRDLFLSEKTLKKCFTALAIASVTDELRHALSDASAESTSHLSRLELIFKMLKLKPTKGDSTIVDALTSEAYALLKKNEPGTILRDAAILYSAQHIHHYKIASYEVFHALALELKLEDAAMLLEQCLNEEKNSSAYLMQIARNIIHPAAHQDF